MNDGKTNSGIDLLHLACLCYNLVSCCIVQGFETLTSSPTCHSSAYARLEVANSIIKSGVNRILAIIQLDRC